MIQRRATKTTTGAGMLSAATAFGRFFRRFRTAMRLSAIACGAILLSACVGVPPGWEPLAGPLDANQRRAFSDSEVRLAERAAGYQLFLPPGDGAHPAVIIRHGCGGYQDSLYPAARRHASFLIEHGIAAMLVDSYAPRGIRSTCSSGPAMIRDLSTYGRFDIARAYRALQAHPRIDGRNIFALGMSNGGATVLTFVPKLQYFPYEDVKLRGAIAYYPPCNAIPRDTRLGIPLLVLIGSADDWTSADHCVLLKNGAKNPELFSLKIYPGATHSFDNSFTGVYLGHYMRSDPQVTEDSRQRYLAFIRRNLSEQ